jgi:mannose-1-phosphate guanylyltransferase/mannose-6-phosphate isomerase
MSGGSGTRLWPVSTDERPKQFHALGSRATMLQDTADRVKAEGFLAPLVIGNHRHGRQAIDQLSAVGAPPAAVLLEPFGRNTASVAVIAAEWARRNAPGALVLLTPADHVIGDAAGFRAAVSHAAGAAADHIVTFGITPAGPETGYGYIQSGEALYEGVFRVRRFVEKPGREVAEAYLAEGGYCWNAGIFLYDPAVFLTEAERLCPKVVTASIAALDAAADTGAGWLLDAERFAECPSEPIDIAVMEKTDRAAVSPCDVGWADIGSWSELWRHGERDAAGNHARGEVVMLESEGSLLWSDGPSISVVGIADLIVVATDGHVLVLPKGRAQDVKKIVERWKTRS